MRKFGPARSRIGWIAAGAVAASCAKLRGARRAGEPVAEPHASGDLGCESDEERGGGMVCLIDRVVGGEIAYFTPGRDHYILVENLRLCWRCVDHLPRALFLLDGRLVRSWREMAIAAQVMVTTSMSSV